MLTHTVQSSSTSITPAFYAKQAYDLRSFASLKRYTVQDITAHEVTASHPDREELETFIYKVFYHAYGANVTQFMPKLIALRDADNHLMAAFGMRDASNSALFLEQYLDAPIEQIISSHMGAAIARASITEIGNLAVINPRNAGVLISHVIQHSLDAGVQWCVATAHHSLQNGLIKGGRDVYPLHPVDANRLAANEKSQWGSYYENAPQVIAVRGVTACPV